MKNFGWAIMTWFIVFWALIFWEKYIEKDEPGMWVVFAAIIPAMAIFLILS